MKFVGTFTSDRNSGLFYPILFGNPIRGNAFVEIDSSNNITCILTYLGSYMYGQSKTLKLVLNKELSIDNKCVFEATVLNQFIQIIFQMEGSNYENAQINKTFTGSYISSNPGDCGSMSFKRIE